MALSALLVALCLTLRDQGAYATIMWDEWEYDRFSRLLPPAQADVPYYLYYFLYGATRACGDRFMACAQGFNAVFYATALPIIYAFCRKGAGPLLSLAVALACVLGGISVYATHFMPEPVYFLGFCLYALLLLTAMEHNSDPLYLGISAGIGLALLSLIKLHAVFLLPGLIIFFLASFQVGALHGGWRRFMSVAAWTILSFFTLRLSLGYIIAGAAGLNIAGTAYGARARVSLATPDSLLALLRQAWPYLLGHVAALLTLFGTPLLLAYAPPQPNAADKRRLSLQLLVLSLLLPLLFVVALYTARMSLLDPIIEGGNGHLRLHMRYYNFLFPLLIAATAIVAAGPPTPFAFSPKRLAAALIAAALGLTFLTDLNHYQLSVSDAPELRGFATYRPVAYGMGAFSLFSLGVWVWSRRLAARLYLALLFPLLTLTGAGAAYVSARKEAIPAPAHQAGLFARRQLGADTASLAVIGPEFAGVYQAMFYADNPFITPYMNVPEGSCLTLIPATPAADGKEWLLMLGSYRLLSPVMETLDGQGFTLLHAAPFQVKSSPCPPGL